MRATSSAAFSSGSMPVCAWKSAIFMPPASDRDGRRVERVEIVRAADMASSMKICGTVVRPGALDHLRALRPAERDVIFLEIDALVAEQPLGARAIRAEDLGVDFDARHSASRH
jgi:hypothetical protein